MFVTIGKLRDRAQGILKMFSSFVKILQLLLSSSFPLKIVVYFMIYNLHVHSFSFLEYKVV